jgi:hypothetical protein
MNSCRVSEHSRPLSVRKRIPQLPLGLGRLDLPDKGMKMLHQRLADAPRSRVPCVGHTLQHCSRNGRFVELSHTHYSD